ncbi:uncharacterized protein NECHADRAFT_42574 [Fusarium vanettenii 77-13-4]|uniref:Rhodopsin domain-containing protein n=1 Tax=Fusarium vanettenii (strain ATCC MYA-4622 / CBS 123669 / FGSC 9596 / NRRL 45880 / 77-13-4) TaxID=660122 RepID=C7ZHN9_FUSV7|nr:uncharacterized protein NECHADRAFT_42574 [Fusarium vanettenii 77-13-4]EEU36524.1 hypothetical protein NECHADRAFT_42574 [Fusarium vanettenii 77-13-4]
MPDSDVARAIADGRVPKGITADYLNESKDAPAIAGIVFVTVLTSLVVLGRLISRAFLIRRFGLDDILTLISWICFIPFVGMCIKLINLGSGRHFEYIQYVLDMPTIELTEVLDFAAHIIYTTTLLFCRISGLAFYYRLCSIHDKLLLAIKIVMGILILGYLPQLFLLIFHCIPVTGLWPYDFQPGFDKYTCLQWGLVYSGNGMPTCPGPPTSNSRSHALRSLNFRPEHDVLTSRDTSAEGINTFRTKNQRDNQSENSADGILVSVDFRIKEDSQRGQQSDGESSWKSQ